MKLSASQFHAFKEGVSEALKTLSGGDLEDQLLGAVLADLYKKLHNMSLFEQRSYSVKFTPAQKVATVLAIKSGLIQKNQYMAITSGAIMMELHKQLS